jgi:hypothetical protein
MWKRSVFAAIAIAIVPATAAAENWRTVSGLDYELYDRPSYSAETDAVYVRIFMGVPGRAYDERLMTNYETELVMSCAKNLENWRYITSGVSKMGWHEVVQLSNSREEFRNRLCGQKATLPPWPGMAAE